MPDITQPSPSSTEPDETFTQENVKKPVRRIQVISSNDETTPETVPALADEPVSDSDELLSQIDSIGDDTIPAPESSQDVLVESDNPLSDSGPVDETETMRDGSVIDSDDDEGSNVHIGDPLLEQADLAALNEEDSGQDKPKSSKRWFKSKWFWLGLIVLAIIAVLAVPQLRYKVLGLVVHKSVIITVDDSVTNTPVSDVTVTLGNQSGKTTSAGTVELSVPIGKATLVVAKQYYSEIKRNTTIELTGKTQFKPIELVATGRLVPIMIENTVSSQPLADALVQVAGTTARTTSSGEATIVLPTRATTYQAKVSLANYSTVMQNVTVTMSLIGTNIIHLTPTGKLFFLSDASGTIDVVKANLDGTGRQTILAGTGTENPNKTVLLAAKDWQYMVLQSQRSASQTGLYLIDGSTGKTTEFDNSSGDFTLVGWYGHDFVYDVTLNSVPTSQSGHELVKVYDAETGQLLQLDSNQATGTNTSYAFQSFYNFYIIGDNVIYDTQWNTAHLGANAASASTLNDTIRETPLGSGTKKDDESVPAAATSYIQTVLANPQTIYYSFTNSTTNAESYYEYDGTSVSSPTNLNQTTFTQSYPSYLFSPAGTKALWAEILDGATSLVVGNTSAQNPQTIAHLNGYTPYGWYGNNYILVVSSGNLYIMPATGLTSSQKPYLVSSIYQSGQTFNNIESSYGGQ
jgi:hypothetical protein